MIAVLRSAAVPAVAGSRASVHVTDRELRLDPAAPTGDPAADAPTLVPPIQETDCR